MVRAGSKSGGAGRAWAGVLVVALASVLSGCSSAGREVTAEQMGRDPLPLLASMGILGDPTYACEDMLTLAARAGFDYVDLMDSALAGDAEAVRSLARLRLYADVDEVSGTWHALAMWMLLHRLGDEEFSGALAGEPWVVRADLSRLWGQTMGSGELGVCQDGRFSGWFPRTAGVLCVSR